MKIIISFKIYVIIIFFDINGINYTIMNGLALCAMYIGISGALKGDDTLQMIICFQQYLFQ